MILCCKCKNANICKSPFKGDNIRECGNYIANVIDWEQRRYEIAKDILANIIHCTNNSAYSYEELAIQYADSLIKKLKEK